MAARKRAAKKRAAGKRVTALTRRSDGGLQLRSERAGTWTSGVRERFLSELSLTANVRASASAVDRCFQGAYQLRKRDPAFRAAWDRAVTEGHARLGQVLLERALLGEELLRAMVDAADTADDKLERLMRYPNSVALTLYRAHRPAAERVAEAADEAIVAAARERVKAKLDAMAARLARAREKRDAA